ncbi:ATP-grasp domain-containing protein [Streptomyces sp. NPDC002285]
MTRKSVLLLNDDTHFVQACADAGVDVTIVCSLEQKDFGAMSPLTVQRVFVDTTQSAESVMLGLYRSRIDLKSFDAVYSNDETAVVTAAAVGSVLGIPSLSVPTAALFRDKSLAKAALRKAGVETADFVVIDDLCELPDDFVMPFASGVLKPVTGGATYYTTRVRSDADLRAAVERARAERRFRTFVLEEFVPGEEWHADGILFDGKLLFMSVGGYKETCLETLSQHKWIHTYVCDPVEDADVYNRVRPLADQVMTVLGLRTGIFHLELFHDQATGRITFGECAARRGGGLIEEEIRHKFGVSLTEAALLCALGQQPEVPSQVQPGAVGSAYLPYEPGVLVSHPSDEELTELPNVQLAVIEWPVGSSMDPVVSTIMKIGQVMLVADDREELFRRADEVSAWFKERTVVIPPRATGQELREWYAAVHASHARSTS